MAAQRAEGGASSDEPGVAVVRVVQRGVAAVAASIVNGSKISIVRRAPLRGRQ